MRLLQDITATAQKHSLHLNAEFLFFVAEKCIRIHNYYFFTPFVCKSLYGVEQERRFFCVFFAVCGKRKSVNIFYYFLQSPVCYFDLQVLANKETKNLFFLKRIDVAHHRC